MQTDEVRLVLTVVEAGRLLGISRATSYDLVAAGVIPSLRLGKRLVVPRSAIDRMLDECGKSRN